METGASPDADVPEARLLRGLMLRAGLQVRPAPRPSARAVPPETRVEVVDGGSSRCLLYATYVVLLVGIALALPSTLHLDVLALQTPTALCGSAAAPEPPRGACFTVGEGNWTLWSARVVELSPLAAGFTVQIAVPFVPRTSPAGVAALDVSAWLFARAGRMPRNLLRSAPHLAPWGGGGAAGGAWEAGVGLSPHPPLPPADDPAWYPLARVENASVALPEGGAARVGVLGAPQAGGFSEYLLALSLGPLGNGTVWSLAGNATAGQVELQYGAPAARLADAVARLFFATLTVAGLSVWLRAHCETPEARRRRKASRLGRCVDAVLFCRCCVRCCDCASAGAESPRAERLLDGEEGDGAGGEEGCVECAEWMRLPQRTWVVGLFLCLLVWQNPLLGVAELLQSVSVSTRVAMQACQSVGLAGILFVLLLLLDSLRYDPSELVACSGGGGGGGGGWRTCVCSPGWCCVTMPKVVWFLVAATSGVATAVLAEPFALSATSAADPVDVLVLAAVFGGVFVGSLIVWLVWWVAVAVFTGRTLQRLPYAATRMRQLHFRFAIYQQVVVVVVVVVVNAVPVFQFFRQLAHTAATHEASTSLSTVVSQRIWSTILSSTFSTTSPSASISSSSSHFIGSPSSSSHENTQPHPPSSHFPSSHFPSSHFPTSHVPSSHVPFPHPPSSHLSSPSPSSSSASSASAVLALTRVLAGGYSSLGELVLVSLYVYILSYLWLPPGVALPRRRRGEQPHGAATRNAETILLVSWMEAVAGSLGIGGGADGTDMPARLAGTTRDGGEEEGEGGAAERGGRGWRSGGVDGEEEEEGEGEGDWGLSRVADEFGFFGERSDGGGRALERLGVPRVLLVPWLASGHALAVPFSIPLACALFDFAWAAYYDPPSPDAGAPTTAPITAPITGYGRLDAPPHGFKVAGRCFSAATDTCALVLTRGTRVVVACRGTVSRANVQTDLAADRVAVSFGFEAQDEDAIETGASGSVHVHVHRGFWTAYASIRDALRGTVVSALADIGPRAKLFCTGHSLGGALALLASYDLGRFVAENRAVGRREVGLQRMRHLSSSPVPSIAELARYQAAAEGAVRASLAARVRPTAPGDMLADTDSEAQQLSCQPLFSCCTSSSTTLPTTLPTPTPTPTPTPSAAPTLSAVQRAAVEAELCVETTPFACVGTDPDDAPLDADALREWGQVWEEVAYGVGAARNAYADAPRERSRDRAARDGAGGVGVGVGVGQSSVREGSVRQGSVRQGSVRQGSVRQGSVREGSVRPTTAPTISVPPMPAPTTAAPTALDAMALPNATDVVCVTFGSPRVGGYDFARRYQRRVPATFRVDHDGDPIPDIPKLGWLYKHVGTEVVVDAMGNAIVAPTFFEKQFRAPDWSNFRAHAMVSYRRALLAARRDAGLRESATLLAARRAAVDILVQK